jgi:branched-chain amino acid transport system substrate-binding protein
MKGGLMMKKILFVVLVVLLWAAFTRAGLGEEAYLIGFNMSLTKTAAIAFQMKSGCELAIEDINAAGGIKGIPLKLLVDDNKLLPTEAVLIAKKTLPSVQATIVGASGSCFLAVMPLAAEAKVPIFGPGVGTRAITERGNKYVFRTHFNDKIGAYVFVNYLVKNLKLRKIAIVSEDRDYGIGGATAVKEALTKFGIKPAGEEKFRSGMVDFLPIVARLKQLDPEAIALWGFPNETSIFAKQAREAGIKVPMGGCNALESDKFMDLAGQASDNIYYVSPYYPDPKDARIQAFIKRFEQKFKDAPDVNAFNCYDTIQIIAEGLRTAGKNRDAFRDAISGIRWKGLNGEIAFDANGDNYRPLHVIRWQDGKRIKVATFDITKLF